MWVSREWIRAIENRLFELEQRKCRFCYDFPPSPLHKEQLEKTESAEEIGKKAMESTQKQIEKWKARHAEVENRMEECRNRRKDMKRR